jgi:2-oxo-hept-3-ene-1,7-dioate hydratase
MSLGTTAVQFAARALYRAEKTGDQIRMITLDNPDMDMDDAYQIQAALMQMQYKDGKRKVGWKIGLTSKAMQLALNIDIPDSGVLLDTMVFETGAEVPQGRFIQPRIEAEIAFIMKHDLHGQTVSREAVIAATDCVTPSLEILDTRIQGKTLKPAKAAASWTPYPTMPPMPGSFLAPRVINLRALIPDGLEQSWQKTDWLKKPVLALGY